VIATTAYPKKASERSRWIVERRGAKNPVSPDRAYAQFIERERMEDGRIAEVATIFLTNRECPWKCVMCDLWRNTAPAAPGGISKQIERALEALNSGATVLKLYNSGSFFDEGAIPKSDWPEIARICSPFEHVIVECHPKLVDARVLEFAQMIPGTLEVAMGLETADPQALEKINKRITVEDFVRAAAFLRENQIAVRTFLLVGVPFIATDDQALWVERSIENAFSAGSSVVALIPTRTGNGAMDDVLTRGNFVEPRMTDLERAQEYGLNLRAGRVFADTWDIERFAECGRCADERIARLGRMNLSQQIEPRVECHCAA
jgi:radical SAM enzyme (TIGR01210 family)